MKWLRVLVLSQSASVQLQSVWPTMIVLIDPMMDTDGIHMVEARGATQGIARNARNGETDGGIVKGNVAKFTIDVEIILETATLIPS
jgi:hypothetical protein